MSRGDVASVVVQYSDKRSVRARKHLARARETWWLLLEELDRALASIPAERRPEIVVYGESLGAQVVAEVLSEGGAETLQSFNIARGALMGLPFAGGRQLRALRERGEPLPDGLGVFADLELGDDVAQQPAETLRRRRAEAVFRSPRAQVLDDAGDATRGQRGCEGRTAGRTGRGKCS